MSEKKSPVRAWKVKSAAPAEGIWITEHSHSVIFIPRADIEIFIKQVFSAVTGREFMGEFANTPREFNDEPDI